VFNGANNQAPLIGKYSGTTNPGTLTASSGKMYLELRSDCATTRAGFAANWSSTGGSTGCPTDGYEANETLSAGASVGVNVNNTAYICPTGDVDWYKFTSSSTNNNLKITLTNLPLDYDLEMYNAGGTLLYSSTQSSTTAETITYNGAPAATYYVKVYGYNGNTSTSAYTLRVSTQATAWQTTSRMAYASRTSASGKPMLTITNPVEAGARAWLTASGYTGKAEITLRNAQGQPVGAGTNAQLEADQPLGYALPAGLRPGVYVVTVQLGTGVQYLRLLVQ